MIQAGAESLGELKWCCLFFQGAEGLKWVKKEKEIHFDSKQTVKFLTGSSKFRAHAVPVCALVVCAQSMGVLPCSQQMLFVLGVPFGTTAGRVYYTNTSLRSGILQRGREGWQWRRQNKAIKKVNEKEELLQSQFCSFCCLCCWKKRRVKWEVGLLFMSWLPCGSSTVRIFLSLCYFWVCVFTKGGLLWHWFCPAIGLGPASQFEDCSFSPYFHSCWND